MGGLAQVQAGGGIAVGPTATPSSDTQARSMIADATRTLGGATYVDTKELAAAAIATASPSVTAAIERQLTATQRGEFARETDRLADGPQWGVGQIVGANNDFLRNYADMRAANTIGADTYFHCKANFEAAARGPWGAARADTISDARELVDQYIKGDPASASARDQAANIDGRNLGTLNPSMMAREACNGYRPNGLDPRY